MDTYKCSGETHYACREIAAERDRLRAEVERKDAALGRARQLVTDNSPSTVYADKDDECGAFGCCGDVTYRGHEPGCWWVELRAVLAAKGE